MRKSVASMLLVSLLLTTNIAHAGTIGFGNSGNSGTVGFGSSNPNANGTIGFGSSSNSSNGGTIGFGTQSANNGTVGFSSSNSSVALYAEKAVSSPSNTILSTGSAMNTVLKVDLTAGSNEGINVTELTLKKGGSLSTSHISGIMVVDAQGVRHGNVVTFSSDQARIDMSGNPVFVSAGTTHTISVLVNFTTSTPAPDRTFSVEIPAGTIRATGATTQVARTVEGSFPIVSSTFTMITGNSGTIGFGSNNTNGTIGFGSSSSSSNGGTIGFGSSTNNTNGTIGFVSGSSSNTNGTIGFGSTNSNGTIGFVSDNTNGSIGFGNTNQNGTIGFGNSNQNGTIGFGNTNQNGTIGFPDNGNQNGTIGFPENTRPTVRLLDTRNITNNSATVFFNGYDADNDMLTYEVCLDDAPDTNNTNYTPTFGNCQTTSNEFYRFNNLTANNMYMWTVRVRDSGGLGTTENGPQAFTTLQNAPSNNIPTVTLGSVSNVNNTSATVSWSVSDPDGTSAHQYDICYSASRNNVFTSCRETVSGNSYTLTNLTPGVTYYWTVRVRDGEYSVFPDSGMSSFTTTGTTPTNNQIPSVRLDAATNITSTSATLNWTPLNQDAGETYYYVVCYTTNYNQMFQGCGIATYGTSVNVTNLNPNTTYYWDVRVSDGTYSDQYSLNGPLSFRTNTSGTTNNSPTALLLTPSNATTVTTSNVQLQWSATDVDAGDQANLVYRLYVRSVNAGTVLSQNDLIQDAYRVTLPSNNATSYTYTSTNGMDVYWTVTVSDQRNATYFPAQNGPFRFFARHNTTGNRAPDFVNTSFQPTDNFTFTSVQPVTLTWNATDADGDALTYALYVMNQNRTDAAPSLATVMNSANRVNLSNNSATNYTLSVSNDRAYYWVVTVTDNRIANPVVAFAEPRVFFVNTNATGNMAPVVTLTSPTDQSIQSIQSSYPLTWTVADDNASNVRYTVYAREVSQTQTLQPSELVQDQYAVASNLSTLTVNRSVTPGNRLYWTVRAIDGEYDPLANNGPFYFDVQSGSTNNTAPVVTLVSPVNGGAVAQASSYRLAWNVQDNNPANVRYEVYARQVNSSTVLARADVEQSQYRIATDLTNTYFDVMVGNGNRLYWSVRAIDGEFSPYATNAPFVFTVAPTTFNNLSTELALLNSSGNTQTTWNSPDTATVRVRLRNFGTVTQTIGFPTSREFDVVVTNTATGQVVRQASYNATATNTPTTRTLGAGATQDYTFEWNMRDNDGNLLPTGTYRVEGYVLSDNPLIAVSPVTITVNGTTANIPGLSTELLVSNSVNSTTQVSSYGPNNTIAMRVVAWNTTGNPMTLTFNGRATRILATQMTQNQVYFNSDLANPTTTVPSTVTIPANGSHTFEVFTWNGIAQGGGSRVYGNYRITADILATVATVTVPSRTITLQSSTSGGGGSGGGGSSSGGTGGGGINVDTTTMLNLPTTGSDAELVWYGPINFEPSNGQINRPLRHVEYTSGFSASWDRGTIVTDDAGNRYLGTYYVPSRYPLERLKEPMKAELPEGIAYLDSYFTQYGNLGEHYSKPVTLRGSLVKDPAELMADTRDLAILGWDFEKGEWVRLGDISNFDGRFYEVDTDKSTIITVVDTSKMDGYIPGGELPDTDGGYGMDTCLNTNLPRTPFADANNHWAVYYICRLYKMGAVSGYLDGPLTGRYNPEGSVTRAELLTSVMKLYGYDVTEVETNNLFPDVRADEWYTAYISKARDLGIIAGYPDGYFRPHNPVNRAEAMKMILLAAKNVSIEELVEIGTREREDSDRIAGFADVSEDAWYSSYVSYARNAGIISGKQNGLFEAGDVMTRAEMSKVLFLTYTKKVQ